MKDKNVFQKLQKCRVELQQKKLKKSGRNNFAGFQYYELADFLPEVNQLFLENGLLGVFNISNETQEAELTIHNTDGSDFVIFRSPIADANIKGCTPVQSLGGVHTYLKRYLYMNALEIVESDMFDIKAGDIKTGSSQESVYTQKPKLISPKQIEIISKYYKGKNLTNLLEKYEVESLDKLSLTIASELISKLMQKKGELKDGK